MSITLEALGLTREQLTELVVNQAVDKLLLSEYPGDPEEGESAYMGDSQFGRAMKSLVAKRINEKVAEIAEAHVLPSVAEMVESLTLQATNQWGEARGEKLSFVEYMAKRAEEYMREPVDFEGRAKNESFFSTSKPTQARIAHLIHKHLHYSIEQAMQKALKDANSAIVEGLEATVKMKLAEVAAKLHVAVKS